MGSTANNKIACPSCGKQFRWKVELAGRKVRCTCSQIMAMPVDAPPPIAEAPATGASSRDTSKPIVRQREVAPSDGYELDAEPPKPNLSKCPACNQAITAGAVICVKCGFHIQKGERMATAVQKDAAAANEQVGIKRDETVPAGAMLAAQAMSGHRAEIEDDGSVMRDFQFKEYYLPLGLMALGVVLTIWRFSIADLNIVGSRVLIGSAAVFFQLVIMVPMMLVAVMLAAKIADIAFGAAHTAVLKLAAIAIGPMALAELIIEFIGFGGVFLGAFIHGVCVCPFLAMMFDLDYFETMLTFVLMMLIRFVFSGLIILIFLGFLFA